MSGLYLGFTPLALPWQITGINYLGFTPLALLWVYPFDSAEPGVYTPDHLRFTPQMGSPLTFRGKGVNPAIDLTMNLIIFSRAWN